MKLEFFRKIFKKSSSVKFISNLFSAKQSNIGIIVQRFQNRVLRNTLNAPGTLETMTFTETWKWKSCLAKSRDFHKSTKKVSTIMRTLRPYSSWTTWA